MLGTRGVYWRLVHKVAAPAIATLAAWATVQISLLRETEFRVLDHGHAPEDSARLIGIAAVIALNLMAAAIISDLTSRAEAGLRFPRYLRRRLNALSLVALAALGAAFAVLDMTFCVGESTNAVLAALAIGLFAVGPLLLDRAIGVRRLLAVIAVYGVFACWIGVQRNIDWNMRRHFLRAYAQIHPGMTEKQVDGVMRKQFHGKRPLARFDDSGVQYTLDPDDGRFNSEFIVVRMIDGKVVEADYLRD